MNEVWVAAKLKEKNRQFLVKPISDKYGVGTPDRILLLRGKGDVVWAELKFLRSLPKNHSKVGLHKKQAGFLSEWSREGGNSCLIVGIGDEDKAAIFYNDFSRISIEGVKRDEFLLVSWECVGEQLKQRFMM